MIHQKKKKKKEIKYKNYKIYKNTKRPLTVTCIILISLFIYYQMKIIRITYLFGFFFDMFVEMPCKQFQLFTKDVERNEQSFILMFLTLLYDNQKTHF